MMRMSPEMQRPYCFKHVRQERHAAQFVQHFRAAALHPGSLARREDEDVHALHQCAAFAVENAALLRKRTSASIRFNTTSRPKIAQTSKIPGLTDWPVTATRNG